MMTLTVMAIVAIVGLAGYCMVCERLAANQIHETTRPARSPEVRPLPHPAAPTPAPVRVGLVKG